MMSESGGCKGCERHGTPGPELFKWGWGAMVFNVDRARQIVSDGREVKSVPHDWLINWLKQVTVEEGHLDHIQSNAPGILATNIEGGGKAGILIDGNHRAKKAVNAKQPFLAHVLTAYESFLCLEDCSRRATMVEQGIVPTPDDLPETVYAAVHAGGELTYRSMGGNVYGWVLRLNRKTTPEERAWLMKHGFNYSGNRWFKRCTDHLVNQDNN